MVVIPNPCMIAVACFHFYFPFKWNQSPTHKSITFLFALISQQYKIAIKNRTIPHSARNTKIENFLKSKTILL